MRNKADLSELFEKGRKAAPEAPVEKVLSALGTGKTSPLAAKHSLRPRRIKYLFNPLKILIMITPIVVITATLLLFNSTTDLPQAGKKSTIGNDQVGSSIKEEEKVSQEVHKLIEQKQQGQVKTRPAGKSSEIPVAMAKSIDKDSVFSGIILDLSKEELTRLGFMFDEEGYYYLNKLPDGSKMNFWSHQAKTKSTSSGTNGIIYTQTGGGSFGFASGGFVNQANKSKLNEFDFYPVLTTNLSGEDMYPINQIKAKVYSDFELMNDTLVPVFFSRSKLGGYDTEDKLIWFKVSDQFFDLLKTEQSEKARHIYDIAKDLDQNRTPTDRVVINYSDYLPQPFTVKLKPEVLECFGIVLSKDRVDYKFSYPGTEMKWWVDQSGIGVNNYTLGSGSEEISLASSDGIPLIMTDGSKDPDGNEKKGKCPMIFAVSRKFNGNTVGLGDYLSDLDLMVPVQIDDPEASDFLRELIIWIYPNEQFFSCLPSDTADQMRKEFNYQFKRLYPNFVPKMGGSFGFRGDIISGKGGGLARDTARMGGSIGIRGGDQKKTAEAENIEQVPCVYFTNLCESLPGLDYVNLYPNPATDKLNVDLVLQKAKKIQFRVFDLGGRLISDEESPKDFPAGGQYNHLLDISKLQGGFYLLVMTDEEGAKLTRRFVKN